MNRNNYLYSQNWYSKQLSPFGKKVLQVLIKHKNKGKVMIYCVGIVCAFSISLKIHFKSILDVKI